MKIEKVTFGKLVSGPNFSHTKIEAKAKIDRYETPEQALDILRGWVLTQLGIFKELEDSRDQIEKYRRELISWEDLTQNVTREVDKLRNEFEWYRSRINSINAALIEAESKGVTIDPEIAKRLEDDIPF